MKNNFSCGLDDLFAVFEETVSPTDIVVSRVLSKISSAIVKQRIDLGMTQKQFAEYMGVSQGMVSKWESEDYNFSIKSLAEVAVKLDLDVDVSLSEPMTNREKYAMACTAYLANAYGLMNQWVSLEGISNKKRMYDNNVTHNEGGKKWLSM